MRWSLICCKCVSRPERRMREPAFWQPPTSRLSRLLIPIGAIYGEISGGRMARKGVDVGIPVLCVGNYHVGGAGKTPTTLALVALLRELGETPVVLSRGYGGEMRGPGRGGPIRHAAFGVGGEPLMLAGGGAGGGGGARGGGGAPGGGARGP